MRSLVAFRVQRVWFGIDAEHVEQILGQQAFMPVPTASPEWPGVMAFRGRAVAVLELGGTTERRARTIIARANGCTVALPVDEVREVQTIDEDQVTPAHATAHRMAREEAMLGGVMIALLDLPALIREATAGAHPS
jgi:chemotaxis signal transduction protein